MSAGKTDLTSEKFELNSGDEGGKINYGSTAGEDEETEVGTIYNFYDRNSSNQCNALPAQLCIGVLLFDDA